MPCVGFFCDAILRLLPSGMILCFYVRRPLAVFLLPHFFQDALSLTFWEASSRDHVCRQSVRFVESQVLGLLFMQRHGRHHRHSSLSACSSGPVHAQRVENRYFPGLLCPLVRGLTEETRLLTCPRLVEAVVLTCWTLPFEWVA